MHFSSTDDTVQKISGGGWVGEVGSISVETDVSILAKGKDEEAFQRSSTFPLTFFFLVATARWRCPAGSPCATYVHFSYTNVRYMRRYDKSVEQVKKLSNVSLRHEFLMFSRRKSTRRKHGEIALPGSTQARERTILRCRCLPPTNSLAPPTPLVLHSSNHSLGSFTYSSDRLDFRRCFSRTSRTTSKPAHIHLFHPTKKKKAHCEKYKNGCPIAQGNWHIRRLPRIVLQSR